MCQSRNTGKAHVLDKIVRVDKCLENLIDFINTHSHYRTLGCCCGHSKYPMTIVVQPSVGEKFELLSNIIIPRKKRFYIKDKYGYYYIPEVKS